MFSYLQKIGKALMVPVAVLPAAAIMLGIGYWIDPNGWGANSQLAAFVIKKEERKYVWLFTKNR